MDKALLNTATFLLLQSELEEEVKAKHNSLKAEGIIPTPYPSPNNTQINTLNTELNAYNTALEKLAKIYSIKHYTPIKLDEEPKV